MTRLRSPAGPPQGGGPGYPARLERRHRLADGRTVTVRPGDGAEELRFLLRLSPESRYLRFQGWVQAPAGRLAHPTIPRPCGS